MTNRQHLDVVELSKLTCDEFDERVRPAPEQVGFEAVMQKAMSRRDFFKGSAMLLGSGLFAQSAFASSQPAGEKSSVDLGFVPIEANTNDTVSLPKGYRWKPLVSWGDALWSGGEWFNPKTLTTAKSQGYAFGDNNDGMESFVHQGKQLLAINNEYINFASFYANRKDHLPAGMDDVLKAQKAVGVTVVEVAETKEGWQVVQDSPFNRKITAQTPIEITGPARGHKLMQTKADPRGIQSLGTWANCGSGKTPWGTYLTCEENFNTFYSCSDESMEISSELKRYGVGYKDRGYAWGQFDERFDVAKEPNEPNRSGYVVEIDPSNPNAKPKKRTALGRFKHENAEVTISKNGHVVIYLGDDERGEFLYRYVSNNVYRPGAGGDAMDDLMENGTLSVAKFHEDGSGQWLLLTPETTGMALAEICIHTRQAASKVGATTMDRPEWVAVNPHKAEAYCALTNNKHRGIKPNKGGDAQPVGGPNPREANQYGQIVRWIPENNDHGSESFHWNLFVMAGNPLKHRGLKAGSQNVHSGNLFNSPDGLSFDTQGRLWIQTDGKYSNTGDFEGMGNNQMLVADTQSGEIQRFMVGPKECEITGLTWSEDKKTMFVGIQHPGEKGTSNFPYGDIARSTVIAVWREDGKVLG
ncbi:PhoX family phosphatase [Thiomicrorhabdus indica]|uniref:PhoX family protein n=1 Tax=Thiomicrorhabdus indica TaxID=2267253 RepID=UPI002AA8BA6D|nr:PhoX family phosphatase [Thiomicrorhabdus indica]